MHRAMRRARHALLLTILATSAGTAEECRPIAGLDPLIRPGAVLLLGEIHGTAESPAFVGDAACAAARSGHPVVVALEQPVAGQEELDSFFDSDGGEAARRDLLAGFFWQSSYQDGRASRAMLELIERARRLGRSGASVRVTLFDVGSTGGGQARDRGMATRLAELAAEEEESVILVLTGNLHSRTRQGRPGNADYEPMGHLLARQLAPGRVVALMQANGSGTAWVCAPECGITGLGGRRGERPWEVEIGDSPPPGHDGWYRIGAITASPPAKLSAAERAALRPASLPSSTPQSPPAAQPAPPQRAPAGPLSSAEKRVQGSWQGYDSRRGHRNWTLDVDGRGFRAEGAGEWYEGRLVVKTDREPAWIDFVIERCRCAYEGATSEAVFGWEGDALMVAAAAPGSPRPGRLGAAGSQMLRFVRR